jgi:hypothetical protein
MATNIWKYETIYFGEEKKLPVLSCYLSLIEVDTLNRPTRFDWQQHCNMFPTVNETSLIYNSSISKKGMRLPITEMSGQVLLTIDCSVIKTGQRKNEMTGLYNARLDSIKDIGNEQNGELKDTVFLQLYPDVNTANSEDNVVVVKYSRDKAKNASFVDHIAINIEINRAMKHLGYADDYVNGIHFNKIY